MNKKELSHWLDQIAGEMQGASDVMKVHYGNDHENADQLFNASLKMKDWVEEIKKDAKKT